MPDENQIPEEVEAPEQSKRKLTSKLNIAGVAGLLAAIAVIAGLQYGGVVDFTKLKNSALSNIDSSSVVATVNGAAITNGEVEGRLGQIRNVLKSQGANVTDEEFEAQYRERIIDELITNQLLLSAAAEEGIAVTDEQIDAEYDSLVEMFGGKEALDAQLSVVGISNDELRKNLREQKIIEAYVAAHSEIEGIEVTDEEARARYDESVGTQTEGVPAFDEVKDMLKEQIAQEKAADVIGMLVEELKQDATIERI